VRGIYGVGREIAGWATLVAIAAAVALLVKGLYPADLPQSPSPDLVDNVFDNRGVLWAARLLLVSAAGVLAVGGVFIVVSIGIRMRNGEWLRRAGPFEISDRDASETEFWLRIALASREEAVTLRERLQSSEELIDDLENR
jgi:hypothetical protein